VTIVLRHSERVSFHNVPMNQWNAAGITENGARAAGVLGGLLVENTGARRAQVFSWGQRRCEETARAIASAMARGGTDVRAPGRLTLQGPIADYSAYERFILSGRTSEMLDRWQRGEDVNGSLVPVSEYAPKVLREILNFGDHTDGQLCLIATHDLHILPLACYALRDVVQPPDYLDGIVIGKSAEIIRIGYGQHSTVTSAGRLTT
jgi:broad specificity phosphatase PhoE